MYEKEFNELFKLAENRVEDMDIILSEESNFNVKVVKQEIEAYNYSNSRGLGIRVKKDGKIGYSYTEDFSTESFKLIINEAIENANIVEKEELVIFENYKDIEFDQKIYEAKFEKVSVEEKIQLAKQMESYAFAADPRVKNVNMSVFSNGSNYRKIANSKGLDKETQSNLGFMYLSVIVEENGDTRSSFDFTASRDIKDFNPKELAERCVQKTIALLGKKTIDSKAYPIVFSNDMTGTIIGTFSSVFTAEDVHEGKSLLKGKLNEVIASEKITLMDDAHDPKGFSTAPFDGEGYPTQVTTLIDNGTLRTYLHNTITAHKDNVQSTGNAARGYKSSLMVAPSNLKLLAGKVEKADLFNYADEMIEVVALAGMHSGANSISGDFSLSAEGFFYKNGQKMGSLAPFTISGNFYDLLQNTVELANDFEFNSSSIGAPSILVKDLNVSL